MNKTEFVVRNLRFHARGNLAVLLGAAVGAAVLTGALLVGDSLRGSLRDRTERQLGNIDTVLIGPRFLRAQLAEELPGKNRGALLLQGTVHAGTPEGDRRAGKVTVWGINSHFGIDQPELEGDEPIAILSSNLAKTLNAKVGDVIFVGVQKASSLPRSSFLSRRSVSDTTSNIRLTVKAILSDTDPANALSLSISPTLPSNMFIPITRLQQEIEQPGKVNVLMGTGQTAQSLQSELKTRLSLDDLSLKVFVPAFRKAYVSVESTRLILEPSIIAAVEKTAREMGLDYAKSYTYLANEIQYGKKSIPYSIVAALDTSKKAPLGPFSPDGKELKPDEIVLVDWKLSPIKIDPQATDAKITLKYYNPEVEGELKQSEHTFTYRGMIPLDGVANDRNLTPDFPGITDQAEISSWRPPFDIDLDKINKKTDEKFWNDYRTTPKAYIRLEDGQKLWGTRFGDVTSIRIAPKAGQTPEQTQAEFAERLLKNIDPESAGLVFQPIRERMLAAGKGSTDFGMLFLSFSFFLIVAALMLVGLLFRLNLDRRAREIGLLRASGFPLRTVRWLLLIEGLLLASLGSFIGLIGALAYADAMIRLLVALWPTPGVESYLSMHVTPMSLGIGFVASIVMSGLAILWALRTLSTVAPAQLLKGDMTPTVDPRKVMKPSPWPLRIALTSILCAIALALAAPSMPPGEPQAGAFFGSGALLLTAGLTLLWAWMKKGHHALLHGHGLPALARLGSRNAVRNPTRSLLTAALLASASFLLVAVESFRREPDKDFLSKSGGSGGFPLLAESATPIDFDLTDEDGQDHFRTGLQKRLQDLSLTAIERSERLKEAMAAIEAAKIYRFRVKGGDDASCLNLYQASRPRIFGVPASIIERGGFSFSASLAEKPTKETNYWKLLENAPPNEPIPCIVEQNTAMWMLKKGLGDVFEVPDEENRPIKLKIVALLKDSVFQSEVLIPDAAFRQHFPRTEGFSFFLIDVKSDQEKELVRALTGGLANYGFETTPTRDRVAAYLAVQNTYLTTFQLLGGFGLLLGVLGLAVVLLRSIWERRAELALLRALGYRVRALNGMVLAENGLLLVLGLGAGIFAALAAVTPHLASGGQIPWVRLGLLLGMVFVVGLSVVCLAVFTTLRAPLIPALREE
ncbi:MAG: ABC transporter permease [Planctomycetes bacterium]|nr:ABC transporter permease [Planctomycetota bacterium]